MVKTDEKAETKHYGQCWTAPRFHNPHFLVKLFNYSIYAHKYISPICNTATTAREGQAPHKRNSGEYTLLYTGILGLSEGRPKTKAKQRIYKIYIELGKKSYIPKLVSALTRS